MDLNCSRKAQTTLLLPWERTYILLPGQCAYGWTAAPTAGDCSPSSPVFLPFCFLPRKWTGGGSGTVQGKKNWRVEHLRVFHSTDSTQMAIQCCLHRLD